MTKKKKRISPETKQLLAELEEVVQRLGYKLRYEKGNFEGGYCLLKESRLFVINSRSEAEKRIGIIARNLKEIGIDDIFVKPQIREVIEQENAKPDEKKTEQTSQDNV
jgi:hypothetical protein